MGKSPPTSGPSVLQGQEAPPRHARQWSALNTLMQQGWENPELSTTM